MLNIGNLTRKFFGDNTDNFPKDMDRSFRDVYFKSKNYSMVSMDGLYSIFESLKYINKSGVKGDIVECGVWKGGSMMTAALTLNYLNEKGRKLYLFDTFEGMPEPGDTDKKIRTDVLATEMWKEAEYSNGWAKAVLEEVKLNLYKTGYPEEKIIFVKGKVEETIPGVIPENISLLRLDTDWYSSTYHELRYLYPLLSKGGVLIIDDYGSWSGSRDATDKYFRENNINIYMHRVGTTRVCIKLD